jgi:hypothetical protein
MGVGPGDRVAVPVHTFTASAEVVRYLGADPLFVDVEPDTLNLDARRLDEELGRHGTVKAIMPVHFAGQACDMDAISDIARRHGSQLIEDAAHSFPTTCAGRLIGTIGKATIFSLCDEDHHDGRGRHGRDGRRRAGGAVKVMRSMASAATSSTATPRTSRRGLRSHCARIQVQHD